MKQSPRLRLNDEESFYLSEILQRLRALKFDRFCAGEKSLGRLVDEVEWLDKFIGERRRVMRKEREQQ